MQNYCRLFTEFNYGTFDGDLNILDSCDNRHVYTHWTVEIAVFEGGWGIEARVLFFVCFVASCRLNSCVSNCNNSRKLISRLHI